jgi:hypothetical protein
MSMKCSEWAVDFASSKHKIRFDKAAQQSSCKAGSFSRYPFRKMLSFSEQTCYPASFCSTLLARFNLDGREINATFDGVVQLQTG